MRIASLLALVILSTPAQAQLYTCLEDGKKVIRQQPCPTTELRRPEAPAPSQSSPLGAAGTIAQAPALERGKEFEVKKRQLYATKTALLKLKDEQPGRYVAFYLDYLKGQERLAVEYADLGPVVGLRNEISNEYLGLGNTVRFKLKQPNKAIELYAAGEKVGDSLALTLAAAAADTYQFDLHDKAKALKEYQRAQVKVHRTPTSTNDIEVGIARWAANWLTYQIDYLKTGKTFSGTIGQEDIGGAGLILYFSAGTDMQDDYLGLAPIHRLLMGATSRDGQLNPTFSRNEIGQKLERLPPSGVTLLRTVMLLTLLPDAEAILRYLEKHDPAGYASACFLALVEMVDRQAGANREAAQLLPGLAVAPLGAANPLRVASNRFFGERKVGRDTQPDSRMSTPEQTWNLLIASLKSGNLNAAMACLTPGQQAKFRWWTQTPPDKLRSMAESFTAFSMSADMGEIREAVVIRGKQAGVVYFVNVGGAWKISEM
ncbi:MAG TPA: hypothetical protein VE008_00375 [Burkholderiales bacterium]|nr:hypothetical protein [Burkholderiales bacterium]